MTIFSPFPTETMSSELYEQDFYQWIETTAKLLRDRNFSALDMDNLIEEIETMGRSEKRSLRSALKVLLMHLLKYKYQPEKRSNSWKSTIIEQRDRLKEYLADSPSLKPYLREVFTQCYQESKTLAASETRLSIKIFPVESPFTIEQTLDFDYLPEAD
jgi:predicted DNA-binding ribbon-helix-helix protein